MSTAIRAGQSYNLDSLRTIEEALKNTNESVITVAELKRRLPKRINCNTLKLILQHLEGSNKIMISPKGITWLHNATPALRKAISAGFEL